MRVYKIGDKIAVAAYEFRTGNLLSSGKIITSHTPSILEGVDVRIFNLSIIETPNDPYILFRAVDFTGAGWIGLTIDLKDAVLNLKNVTVAIPEDKYNLKDIALGINTFFDLTEVLHDLHKTMKDENKVHISALAGDVYRKLKRSIDTAFV